jgi:hypothetical protein
VTPDEEEQVRGALAAALPVGAVPPEVVARLDATLAGLVQQRQQAAAAEAVTGAGGGAAAGAHPVDELEQRRRRRWPRVLVAAASLAVLAYGAGTVVTGLSGGGGDAMSTAARDETVSGGGAESGSDSGGGAAPEQSEGAPGMLPSAGKDGISVLGQADGRLLTGRTVVLDSATLREDVGRLVRSETVTDRRRPERRGAEDGDVARLVAPCAAPRLARGDRLAAVRLDGRRATLVVRTPVDGTAEAQVYACDDASRMLAHTAVDTGR